MIVAFCSTAQDMEAPLDSRFGRCANFVYYDTDSQRVIAEKNMAKDAPGGAGAKAVQQLVNQKAGILIAPEVGPQAMEALIAMKIQVFRQKTAKTATQALEAWQNGQLEEQHKPSVTGMHKA